MLLQMKTNATPAQAEVSETEEIEMTDAEERHEEGHSNT